MRYRAFTTVQNRDPRAICPADDEVELSRGARVKGLRERDEFGVLLLTMISRDAIFTRPILSIVSISLLLRLVTSSLLFVVHRFLPSFDASASRLSSPLAVNYQGFVRWDTVYFLEIARNGYTQEQRLAFFPGLPGVLRSGGELLRWARRSQEVSLEDMVVVGVISTTVVTAGAAVLLYK